MVVCGVVEKPHVVHVVVLISGGLVDPNDLVTKLKTKYFEKLN